MGLGIGRLRMFGIAAQPTFGVPAPSATFVVPLTNAPQFNGQVLKALNNAALGSAYQINDQQTTVRFTDVPLEFKVDENQYPLLVKQRYSFASGTVTGETVAYGHTGTYQNSTNCWYTFFLQDDKLQDYIVQNGLFDNLDHTFDNDFVRISAAAIGNYPTQTNVGLTATQPKEFVGRMVSYQDAAYDGTATATSVLTATLNLDFGINSEDTRYGLGSPDIQALELTSDKFMLNVSRRKPDVGYYDDNANGTTKQAVITVQDTGRFVSPTSTRPRITFNMPRAKIENYTEEADLEELTRENFDLTLLKPAGVSNTPMQIVVVNSTSGY